MVKLDKLIIEPKGKPGIKVLFNPTSYSVTKEVKWNPPSSPSGNSNETQNNVNAPLLNFGGGGSRQLTIELFFDVTEPIDGKTIEDVRDETDKIVKLTRIDRTLNPPQPPICKVIWGKNRPKGDFPFLGVISSLKQDFTMFKSDGTPVRAKLNVQFVEFLESEQDQHDTDPEMTMYTVRRGDSLSYIAAMMYQDPYVWRLIAEANDIENPRNLEVGQRLIIPARH